MKEEKAEDITPGLYKHYKGNTYRVLGVIYDSDTDEVKVMYQSTWDFMYYCQSAYEWMKPVEIDNNHIIERFTRIGD